MLGAGLAYFTVFSLAPLLLIVVSIAGFFFGRNDVEESLVQQLTNTLGPQTAQLVSEVISKSFSPGSSWIALIIGIVVLFFGASGVFRQLETALNMIWNVETKPGRSIFAVILEQLTSMAMVGVIGFLLLVSLIATSAISVVITYFNEILPFPSLALQGINIFITFWMVMVLFAVIFKVLPKVQIPWAYIWGGATISSIMFLIGQYLIGLYISQSSSISVYGAASSLVVLLVWVFYSAQILLIGAEYIKAAAQSRGLVLTPDKDAFKTKEVRVDEQEELSAIEQYFVQLVGQFFGSTVEKIDKKYIRPPKTFWQRVKEKLEE